ncbi:Factor arrest protein 11 [Entomophthora muscae]|uniref:Factor arrest protein 11 n=1 Tax=Entomophthora muscae TaxID=34485 RepID=A0ACC2UPQ5_9FUNG|nr:Factor arrest protein 11 [Entomophthora muscae]
MDTDPLKGMFKTDPEYDGLSFKERMRKQFLNNPVRKDGVKSSSSPEKIYEAELATENVNKTYSFDYQTGFSLAQEIDEFYSYTEMARHLDNQKTFLEVVSDWYTLSSDDHKIILRVWLKTLETPDRIRRYRAAQCLLYIAQGEFGLWGSPSEHLSRLIENNHMLYAIGALSYFTQALKMACILHDSLANSILVHGSTSDLTKMNEVNLEIGLLLSLIYLLLEVKRQLAPEGLGKDLASLDPPLVPFLFGLIAKLKEKSFKGYPIKKVLLLLWKVLWGFAGDIKDLSAIKAEQRRSHRMAPSPPHGTPKVTPEEFNLFHQELGRKYPSCSLELGSPYLTTPASGMRWALHSERTPDEDPLRGLSSGLADLNNDRSSPLPLPFITNQDALPRPILEAAELYYRHLYLSLPFVQLLQVSRGMYELDHDPDTRLPAGIVLDAQYDNPMLEQIEELYQQLLPQAYTIMVVILKLLLATVPAARPAAEVSEAMGSFERDGQLQPPFDTPMQLSVDEVDDIRHKEIVSKAASSILIHLLTIFKLSHAAKFEYYAQMLVDSNALLLILKLYGLQDFANFARLRNECDHLCFFKALLRPLSAKERESKGLSRDSASTSPISLESNSEAAPKQIKLLLPFPRGRAVFTAINFFRLLHMLTKQRMSRIMLLVQFKSSIILKRGLRAPHPLLRKYIYKVLRSQVPFLGRKWRQNNMKIITAIYLQHNMGLKEDWVLTNPLELNPEHQTAALRELITYYHNTQYPSISKYSVMSSQTESKKDIPASSNNLSKPPMLVCRSQSSSQAHTLGSNLSSRTQLYNSRSVNSIMPLNASNLTSAVQDLDDEFTSNYEDWLEQEVYNRPEDSTLDITDWEFGDFIGSPPVMAYLEGEPADEYETYPNEASSIRSSSPPLSPNI